VTLAAESTESRGSDEPRRAWLREVGVLALGALVYFGVRVIVEGSEARAMRNAERVLDLESAVGIDIERSFQEFVLDVDVLETLGNLSYVWLHWPLLIAVFVVLFATEQNAYRRLRNAMFLSGAIGLVLFAAFPVSPPRFLDDFVGTVTDDARRHYLPYPLSWTNRFAAFPSFHVGWTLIACLALVSTIRRSWRIVAILPAILVGLAVVSTGNHYVLDAVAGTVIALGAYGFFARQESRPSGIAP
jgi:hypothetical protein